MSNPNAQPGDRMARAGDLEVQGRQAGVPIWEKLPLKTCKQKARGGG